MDFYIGFLVVFFYIFFVSRKTNDRKYYTFSLFAIIITLVNACIMPNFIGQFFRYQLRILLVPCLAMSLIVMNFIERKRHLNVQ